MIVAIDETCGIGKGGVTPWHFKEDMQFFAKTTKDLPCIMGRKTYEEIFSKMGVRDNLLPGRKCIVLSRSNTLVVSGATVCQYPEEALKFAGHSEKFVIGGGEIYRLMLEHMDKVYVTKVPGDYDCDTHITDVIDTIESEFFQTTEYTSEKTGLKYCTYIRK